MIHIAFHIIMHLRTAVRTLPYLAVKDCEYFNEAVDDQYGFQR